MLNLNIRCEHIKTSEGNIFLILRLAVIFWIQQQGHEQ